MNATIEAVEPHRNRRAALHEARGWERLREAERFERDADIARPPDSAFERLRELEARAGLSTGGGRAWLDARALDAELRGRQVQARGRLSADEREELSRLDEMVAPHLAMVAEAARARTSAARAAARALADRHRSERLGACGDAWEMVPHCATHGALDHAVPVRCGHVRLCVECRGRRAAHMRALVRAFVDASADPARTLLAVRQAERWSGELPRAGVVRLLGAAATAPRWDRWSLRFLTLTIPHASARTDIRTALDAWAGLVKRIRAHLRTRGHDAVGYVRVLEVTPGDAKDGHAHVHAIVWSPFLRAELIRVWWGRELVRRGYVVPHVSTAVVLLGAVPGCTTAGGPTRRLAELRGCDDDAPALVRDPETGRMKPWSQAGGLAEWRGNAWRFPSRLPWPVIDVRAVRDGAKDGSAIAPTDVADELVKYLVKDLGPVQADGSRERAPVALMAEVYEATEGRRLIVAGAGVWAIAAACSPIKLACSCDVCGAFPEWRASRRERVEPAQARAP